LLQIQTSTMFSFFSRKKNNTKQGVFQREPRLQEVLNLSVLFFFQTLDLLFFLVFLRFNSKQMFLFVRKFSSL
jgi:hypothetical protein